MLLKPFDPKLFHAPAVGEGSRKIGPRSPPAAGIASLVGSKSVTVYVAEIKGRGVAAFHADTGSEAERVVRDRVFRDDLMVLASGGLPLWDGVTDIEVRPARPDEETKWRASRAKAIRRGHIVERDVGWDAFLAALTDRRNRDRAGTEARRFMAPPRPAPDLGPASDARASPPARPSGVRF